MVSIAACLALAAMAWHWHGANGRAGAPGGQRLAERPASMVMGTVQAMSGDGLGECRPVVAGDVLTASNQQRWRLSIWDRHEVTLEPATRLEVGQDEAGGCQLKLLEGKILASVHRAPGEGVFEVTTPEAGLRITGTVFTVSAGAGQTVLSVSQGVVELTSGAGATQPVAAGQTYSTNGKTVVKGNTDLPDVLAVAGAVSDDPAEAIRKSRWYHRRFAPLLALQDYLKSQKVDSDELTTLAVSADLWCVQYRKDPKAELPPCIQRKAGLERAAKFNGHEVKWLAPANATEAGKLAREALAAGKLVLGYGLAGDEEVQVLSADRLEATLAGKPKGYRFLGEAKGAPLNLAVVSKAAASQPSREQLAQEAAEDICKLLAGNAEDLEYKVGQPAMAAWSAAIVAKDEEVQPADPVMQSLNAIGKLARPCGERCFALGVSGDPAKWATTCEQIQNALGGASILTDPNECEKDRRVRRQKVTSGLSEGLKTQLSLLESEESSPATAQSP